MKKALLLVVGAVLMMMTACTKATTFEIYNGTSGIGMYDVKAYEYVGSTVTTFHDLGFLASNSSTGSVEASKDTKQVKVAFKFAPDGEVYTTADFYNLNPGGHTMILIEDNTSVFGSKKSECKVADVIK